MQVKKQNKRNTLVTPKHRHLTERNLFQKLISQVVSRVEANPPLSRPC